MTPHKDGNEANSYDNSELFKFANNASWLVNWFLLGSNYNIFIRSSNSMFIIYSRESNDLVEGLTRVFKII